MQLSINIMTTLMMHLWLNCKVKLENFDETLTIVLETMIKNTTMRLQR